MKVVFTFCEGAHDAALLRRLLPRLPGFAKSERLLKQFPAPFPDFWNAQLNLAVVGVQESKAESGKLAERRVDFMSLLRRLARWPPETTNRRPSP